MRPPHASAAQQPLDYLLATPALVRVLRVATTHGGPLPVAELSRRARLALPSTREAIRRLMEAGALTALGTGRSSLYALRPDHPMANTLAALFAAERMQFDELLSALREAAKRGATRPMALWLYGSVARGEDGPTSDIDLAAVLEAPAAAGGDQLRDALAEAAPAHAGRLSLITLDVADAGRLAAEGAPFWRDIARDAMVIYGDSPAGVLERAYTSRTERA